VERVITGFHVDDVGDWVAELACGHDQHVRHRPPFQVRDWVLEEVGRTRKLGTLLRCPLCDRCELPEGLRLVRSSPEWDHESIPAAFLNSHRIGDRTWGVLRVRQGSLRFVLAGEPDIDILLGTDSAQPIPPGILHRVEPSESVCFAIDCFAVDRKVTPVHAPAVEVPRDDLAVFVASEQGGDPSCWAALVCFECGAILDGGSHRPECRRE
jgi:tellurite methyltransferase